MQLPALRVVWHDDESVSNSIDEYQRDMQNGPTTGAPPGSAVAPAADGGGGWSHTEMFVAAVLASLLTGGGCFMYQQKRVRLGTAPAAAEVRGLQSRSKPDSSGRFAGDESGLGYSSDEDAEVDSHGNPVAKAYVSEGIFVRGAKAGAKTATDILFTAKGGKGENKPKPMKI